MLQGSPAQYSHSQIIDPITKNPCRRNIHVNNGDNLIINNKEWLFFQCQSLELYFDTILNIMRCILLEILSVENAILAIFCLSPVVLKNSKPWLFLNIRKKELYISHFHVTAVTFADCAMFLSKSFGINFFSPNIACRQNGPNPHNEPLFTYCGTFSSH